MFLKKYSSACGGHASCQIRVQGKFQTQQSGRLIHTTPQRLVQRGQIIGQALL